MRARPSLAATVILLALAVASCAKSTEPTFSDIVGIYRLQIAPGASVVLKPEPRSTSTVNVTQATLELDPVWRFSLDHAITVTTEDGQTLVFEKVG